MSVKEVKAGFTKAAADGTVSAAELRNIVSSAGAIDPGEQKAIGVGLDQFAGITDSAEADKIRSQLGELNDLRREAADTNADVQRAAPALLAEAESKRQPGTATRTYGGTAVPEAVKAAVNAELAKGVVPYDVREMKPDPVYDTSHGDPQMHIDGKFNPYAQEQQAVDSMAFDYTELTPQKIQQDMTTQQTWQEINGFTGADAQHQVAQFKTVTGIPKGGTITALYDEASWPQTKARGPGGQKYANNFAILADGSVHAVPASRRTSAEPWRILTTASLGRGKPMLFNGHLGMTNGVITYVGMSGRLCKLAEKGDAKFVDPIAILKAWGFQTAPDLAVTKEKY